MRTLITILAAAALFLTPAAFTEASAQHITDASYRTIGHAKGIPPAWAALYFFFKL